VGAGLVTGKGSGRRPGKDYADGYDNIVWDIDKRRDEKNEANEAEREEIVFVSLLMGLSKEQIDAILEEKGL
jgi:hypothetical protein